MTRINLVPPGELVQQHLVAEYRELPRIFGLAERYARDRSIDQLRRHRMSERYHLGPGHMRFFYDKLGFLARRQEVLIAEMLDRGYKPQFTAKSLIERYAPTIPAEFWSDWEPDPDEIAISRQRINQRLEEMGS